jgi:extradiol dioxygenase family protein
VPASHFGVILDWSQHEIFVARLKAAAVEFVIKPYLRFEGSKGEQVTLFVRDPSNNYLEFKAFRDIEMLFDKDIDNY